MLFGFLFSGEFQVPNCKIDYTGQGSTSSESSKLSTSAIQNIVERLKTGRHRLSMRKSYRNIWKNFNQFFIRLDSKPATW